MSRLTGALTAFGTLSGTIRVFNGDLSKTQFEHIWDQIVERIDSAEIPPITIIDDHLDAGSSRPVANKVINKALSRVYDVYPSDYISGEPYTYSHIYDGGNAPIASLQIYFGPKGESSFTQITELPSVFHHLTNGRTFPEESDGGWVLTNIDTKVYRLNISPQDSTGLYAGMLEIDDKGGRLSYCRHYSSYNYETLVGPWVSSLDEYDPESLPTEGAEVIDLGDLYKTVNLTSSIGVTLENLAPLVGENEYKVGDENNATEAPCRQWGIRYRCDPNLYVIQATGLTSSQRQALIALLDD